MAKPNIIIISGLSGCGKTTLARRLAKRYGLEFYDAGKAFIELAARKGFKPGGADWWETEEGRRFLKARAENLEFDKELDKIVLERISKGNVVVTSRTMPYLSKEGIKIWIATSQAERARRTAARDKIKVEEALSKNQERDKTDAQIYEKLYNFKLGDLAPFDLVIDTDKLTSEQTEQAVVKFLESKAI